MKKENLPEMTGYLELVLYARQRKIDGWDPEPAHTEEEIREKLHIVWKRLWTEQNRLHRLQRVFSLSDAECYLIFLAFLNQKNTDFSAAYGLYGGLTESLVWDMWQQNHDPRGEIRYGFLYEFFLEEKEDILYLKKHIHRYLMEREGQFLESETEMPENMETAFPRAWAVFQRLQALPGNYCFYGAHGIGKRECFFLLAKAWGKSAVFIDREREMVPKLFYGAVFQSAVAVTDTIPEQTWKNYLPYLPCMILISDTSTAFYQKDDMPVVYFEDLHLEERYVVWCYFAKGYPLAKDVSLRMVANQFCLTSREIEKSLSYAEQERKIARSQHIDVEMLYHGISCVLQGDIHDQVRKVACVFQWKDLILPEKQKMKLREVQQQVAYSHLVLEEWALETKIPYGKSISILLCGPPGTGKTMTAQVLANTLHMALYQVDLPSVVSKYVGETEKKLKTIFADAKRSQAILFFDEADVLFGKRVDMKDAQDKYSNMEAAFLLQEIEHFSGIVILATNFMENIDEAFKRRMKYIIEFPFPDKKEREKLWENAIPAQMPRSREIDIPFLAERFSLSGSNIKNVVYHAAFLAAAEGTELSMKHLLYAVSREYEKIGKTFTIQDAGIYGIELENFCKNGEVYDT